MALEEAANTSPTQALVAVAGRAAPAPDANELERRKRLLLRKYSGIWGAKVFWLALFTLVPLVAQLKIVGAVENPSETYIKVSVATLVYVVYHVLGIYNFMSLAHFKKAPDDFEAVESAGLITRCWRIDIAMRVLAPVVALLLASTFLLYSKFHWGSERYTPPVPGFVYLLVGLVPPESLVADDGTHEAKPAANPLPLGAPTWLAIAVKELGVGRQQGQRITEYLASTNLGEAYQVPTTPWSSAFVNWVIEQDGKTGTRSARSASWLEWGKAVPPTPGCIAVIIRSSAIAHAGFYVRDVDADHFELLGGNHTGNVVSRIVQPKTAIKSCRWPD